jgi:very-short-patch-repair endonuclease
VSLFLQRWAKLYTKPTQSEVALEPEIARLGTPYRAQHPVFAAGVVVDFALLEDKIAIEVDGSSHDTKKAQEKDRLRTLKLEKLGWVVVRCRNEDALKEPAATVQRLLMEAKDRRNAQRILANA